MSQRQMMPYSDFLAFRKSLYTRRWNIQPWWLLSWGLHQLGFLEPSTGARTLPQGRFVMLRNVEVRITLVLCK